MANTVVTKDEMKRMDQATCQREGISEYDLMHRAGKNMANYLIKHHPSLDEPFLLFAGSGHNGGDAIVIASLLNASGYETTLIITSNQLTKVAQKALKHYKGVQFKTPSIEHLKNLLNEASVVIDGLFGIGLTRDLEEDMQKMIRLINESSAFVYAIDIASGLDANSGLVLPIAVCADKTLAVQTLKPGHLLQDGKDFSGEIIIIDVGISSIERTYDIYELTRDDIAEMPPIKHHAHKYDYGHVLVLAGSPAMPGAAKLCAHAALFSGSGLVNVACEKSMLNHTATFQPEIIFSLYENKDPLQPMLDKKDAVVFGPGLNPSLEFQPWAETLVNANIPTVIDARGLHYVDTLKRGENIILTPHFGEFARMMRMSVSELKKDPLKYAIAFMEDFSGVLVLKGPTTLIAYRHQIALSGLGSACLATAGSGDVLSGIIASLLGQGMNLLSAAKNGVIMHSLAGIYAESIYGHRFTVASSIIESLKDVHTDLETP